MLKMKRLYRYMLQGFFPLFMMTFCICLFIVLMQFLWRYVDELVGKGLEMSVIGELFFYAALTMVPMALPLAILLASLMLFGNLGERFELTAMKSSGISLLKVMRPLIVLLVFIAIGAFFFQNYALPKAQVKMWTLLYSMRQKSPELDIPEGVFYDQITGYNVFVKHKNRDNGHLYDLMIYDVSSGFNRASIILADSGKLSFTDDKKHLFLKLWQGESFENLKDQQLSSTGVPYRRESFKDKEIMIPFDANFTRMDDSTMRNQYVGKNIAELRHTIDSVNVKLDSVGDMFGKELLSKPYVGVSNITLRRNEDGEMVTAPARQIRLEKPVDVEAVFAGKSLADKQRYVAMALDRAKQAKNEFEFKSFSQSEDKLLIRRHQIEMHKKFTLSIACLIFFFIGAPLGAIIRKGGIGMPIVISVFLFIFYYIIDTAGYKMARDGRMEVWAGMWMSTAVLLPLGIFLTHKAVNDSAVFKSEVYVDFLRKLMGRGVLRRVEMKEVVINEVVPAMAVEELEKLKSEAGEFLSSCRRPPTYVAYWLHGIDRSRLKRLSADLEATVEYLNNTREQLIVNKLMDFPVLRSLYFYQPVKGNAALSFVCMAVFPIGITGYLIGLRQRKQLRRDVETVRHVCEELTELYNKQI